MPGLTILVAGLATAIALFIAVRTDFTRSREGKALAFVALFLLPVAVGLMGFTEHMERAQSRQFCLSCHVMTDYGRSLYIDDPSYVPATHFQNHLVPEDQACYSCHTQYTMFGTVEAKLKGVRHLMVQYFGTPPAPKDIKLYEPFNNRECLHCHLGMRRFEETTHHDKTPTLKADIKANKTSCTSAGCHEFIHDVGDLADTPMWKPGAKAAKEAK